MIGDHTCVPYCRDGEHCELFWIWSEQPVSLTPALFGDEFERRGAVIVRFEPAAEAGPPPDPPAPSRVTGRPHTHAYPYLVWWRLLDLSGAGNRRGPYPRRPRKI